MVIQERYIEHSLKIYSLALATVVLFVGLRYALTPLLLNNFPLAFLVIAVALSAWLGGRGPGLFATGVATILGNFFFLDPLNSLHVEHSADLLKLTFFALEGAGITWVVWKYGAFVKEHFVKPATAWLLDHLAVAVVLTALSFVPLVSLGIYLAELGSSSSALKSYADCFWWTLGITFHVRLFPGDPVTSVGRVFAIFQIFLGWITLVFIIAKALAVITKRRIDRELTGIRSVYASNNSPISITDRFPFFAYVNTFPPKDICNHTVVFGWNDIVRQYIESNLGKKFTVESPVIVICASLTQEMIDFAKTLRSKGFLIVEGNSTAYVLKRFNVGNAKEVLIVHPGNTEADGDMDVLKLASTVSAINEKARIIVEIEHSKYMPYLRDIGVSEVRRVKPTLKLVKLDEDSARPENQRFDDD